MTYYFCLNDFAYSTVDSEYNDTEQVIKIKNLKVLSSSLDKCKEKFKGAPVILRYSNLVGDDNKIYKLSDNAKVNKINVLAQYESEDNTDSFQSNDVASTFSGTKAKLCGVTNGEFSRISVSNGDRMYKSINKGHYFETTKYCREILEDIKHDTVKNNTLSKVLVNTKKDDECVVVPLDPSIISNNNQCTVTLLSAGDNTTEQVIINADGSISVVPGIYNIQCNNPKSFSLLFEVNEFGAKDLRLLNGMLRRKCA